MRLAARIASIRQETPTVKAFTLDLQGREMAFLSGQWVDCYVELNGRTEVAGYSMTSSPFRRGSIDLAVKLSGRNPVTQFLHSRANVGDELQVDGGHGSFIYTRDMGDEVVLIGGGIGVTPLMSILRYVDEVNRDARATLLYSVKSPDEIIFRSELDAMAQRNSDITCLYTVTQPADWDWSGRVGRIDESTLKEAGVDFSRALFYVSGPPPMIRDMAALLRRRDVPESRIKYEDW